MIFMPHSTFMKSRLVEQGRLEGNSELQMSSIKRLHNIYIAKCIHIGSPENAI